MVYLILILCPCVCFCSFWCPCVQLYCFIDALHEVIPNIQCLYKLFFLSIWKQINFMFLFIMILDNFKLYYENKCEWKNPSISNKGKNLSFCSLLCSRTLLLFFRKIHYKQVNLCISMFYPWIKFQFHIIHVSYFW